MEATSSRWRGAAWWPAALSLHRYVETWRDVTAKKWRNDVKSIGGCRNEIEEDMAFAYINGGGCAELAGCPAGCGA